ncbi:MAG: DivIVA domain-containing protein [bacterium]|nr:DivIVA domain-containing protein [bacterium]
MQITIEAIESKDFKWKTRGYDPEEVDSFLDDICDEMARQQEQIQKLQQQLKEARAARPAEAAPAPAAEKTEDSATVQEMLAMAVRLKNETLAEAQKKADEILASADAQAKDRLGNLSSEHDRLTEQVATLKQAAAEYREKFTELLRQQQELLEKADELF